VIVGVIVLGELAGRISDRHKWHRSL
jgi:hypothetical protein